MKINKGLTKIEFNLDRYKDKKAPKYEWQQLALDIIEELKADNKGLIFKICKQFPKSYIEKCLNDTRELAKGDKRDRYFVKLIYK